MAGSFVEITGQLDPLGATAKSRQRITEAAQALTRVEVEVRARNECNAPMAGVEQVAGHRHRPGVVIDAQHRMVLPRQVGVDEYRRQCLRQVVGQEPGLSA